MRAAGADARHALFVTCERARCAAWCDKPLGPETRLRGFRAHAIETWLWAPRLPWVAVTLSASAADEIVVTPLSLGDVRPQCASAAAAFFTPQTAAFSVQPVRVSFSLPTFATRTQQQRGGHLTHTCTVSAGRGLAAQ